MSIMATHPQTDARGAARLLANTAVACFNEQDIGAPKEVTLNNVFRLLEAYRADAFFSIGASSRDCSFATADLKLSHSSETHVPDVREAIEKAREAVFGGVGREGALDLVKQVIRSIAYPNDFARVPDADRTKTREFFEIMASNLKYG